MSDTSGRGGLAHGLPVSAWLRPRRIRNLAQRICFSAVCAAECGAIAAGPAAT